MDWLDIALTLILSVVSFILGYNTGFTKGATRVLDEWRAWINNIEENENEQRKINRPGQSKR